MCTPSHSQVIPQNVKADGDFQKFNDSKGVKINWKVYSSNGGASRCETKDCLCKVRPEKKLLVGSPAKLPDRRTSVYFGEGSSKSTISEKRRLEDFAKSFPNSSFTIIGYTDGCGNLKHNEVLAERRVKAVKGFFSKDMLPKMTATIFKPEITSECDASSRRVDIVAHTKSRITTIIDKIPADVYLIDASGSMWSNWRQWTDLISVSFKPNSRVFLSKTNNCSNGASLNSIQPGGGTEIWYSYWRVLDYMKQGQTLLIVSDFHSDIPLTRRESITIEQKVSEKGVKVIAVTL